MLVALLLQAAQFLPAPAPVHGVPDQDYQRQLLVLSQEASVEAAQLDALAPDSRAKIAAATALALGTEEQARLAALLLAGTRDDGAARALYRAACQASANNTAIACLLAPEVLPPGVAPALAYLAQDPSRALAVRAAALGRLLEHGRSGVWPLARALFQGGTRLGLDPPAYADWPQGPRWELAKRTVLICLNRWLRAQGCPPSTIEPNAAWEDQLRQLEATEQLVQAAAAGPVAVDPRYGARRLERAQTLALFDAAVAGDGVAARALPWLLPQAELTLREAADGSDPERATVAAHVLAAAPR